MKHTDSEAFGEPAKANAREMQALVGVMADPSWRDACFQAAKQKFPAIITYLSQLMAHDASRASRGDTRFEIDPTGAPANQQNHRSSPMMLHTIYGEGLLLDDQLYDNGANRAPRFNITDMQSFGLQGILPAFQMNVQYSHTTPTLLPVLGDTRNADTPMLLWIALEFMKFHNRIATSLTGPSTLSERTEAFAKARGIVTLTWHNIVRNEVLPALAPSCAGDDGALISEQDFFHGLLRAFHSVPLDRYLVKTGAKTGTPLTDFLAKRSSHPKLMKTRDLNAAMGRTLRLWNKDWRVELDLLADPDGPNQTCFSPSFAQDFGSTHIMLRDFKSAQDLGVSPITDYPDLLAHAEKLLTLMAKETDEQLPSAKSVPLSFGFLAESYFAGEQSGRLGPIGAAAFRQKVESDLRTAHQALEQNFGAKALATMENMAATTFDDMTTKHFKSEHGE